MWKILDTIFKSAGNFDSYELQYFRKYVDDNVAAESPDISLLRLLSCIRYCATRMRQKKNNAKMILES